MHGNSIWRFHKRWRFNAAYRPGPGAHGGIFTPSVSAISKETKLEDFHYVANGKDPEFRGAIDALAFGLGRDGVDSLSSAWLVGQSAGIAPPLSDFVVAYKTKVVSERIWLQAGSKPYARRSRALSPDPQYDAFVRLGVALRRYSAADLDLLGRYLLSETSVHEADRGRARSALEDIRRSLAA